MGEPSDFIMGSPLSHCVLGYAFCKLTRTERSASFKLLSELSWFCISSRRFFVLDGVLVLLEIEVSPSSLQMIINYKHFLALLCSSLVFAQYSLNILYFC